MFRTAIALLFAVAIALPSGDADAQRRRRRRAQKPTIDLVSVEKLIRSGKGPDVERAMKTLAASAAPGDKRAVAAMLTRVLATGLPPAASARVLEGVAALELPVETSMIKAYARHRRGRVRSAALFAMARIAPKIASQMVVRSLGDHDKLVRRAAAQIVGRDKIAKAAPSLLRLLRRGDEVAAAPLGKLATADLARQVAELLGAAPDGLIARALGAMLANPKFGPEAVRVEVVKALGGVPGSESIEALTSYVSSTPSKPSRPSRQEAEVIIEKRLTGGGQ